MDDRLLDADEVAQICFVTDDLERALNWFAELTGKTPSHIGQAASAEQAKAVYHGQPTTVGCRLAIFKFANIDVEFLQPGPERSAWRDLLDARGPGCHHIAFRTRDMPKRTAYLESKGHRELQHAEFDGGNGRYAYFDTEPQLGVQIELLEWDSDKVVHG